MLLHALTQRALERALGFERRDLGGRGRRRRPEDLFQDPLAALHRRSPVGVGGRRQDARLRQHAATVGTSRQAHADEFALAAREGDAAQPVEAGQRAVDVGEVGVEQVGDLAVLADDLPEEQLRLAHHRSAQRLAEVGELARIGRDRRQPAELQPLQPEARGQVLRARILEQAAGLGLEVGREPALARQGEELLVGHRTPEEVAEPRSQREVGDRMRVGQGRLVILLGAEDELRRRQHHGHHRLHAGLPRPAGAETLFVDADIALQLGGRRGAAERAAHEPVGEEQPALLGASALDDLGEPALQLRARVGRTDQGKTLADDREGRGRVGRRIEPGERHRVRPGLEVHLGLDQFGAPDRGELQPELLDQRAVDEHADLGGRLVLVALGAEPRAHDVFAGPRGGKHAGHGPRRLEETILTLVAAERQQRRHVDRDHVEVGLLGRHRLGGHLGADRDVALEVHRRERQHVADVVEAVARVVGREVGREVAFDQAQVADRVVVLHAVQPADRHRAWVDLRAGLGAGEQTADVLLQGFRLRLGRTDLLLGRGHLAGHDLVHHVAPEPLLREQPTIVLERLEVDVALREVVPVAFIAVLIQERLHILLEILPAGRPQTTEQESADREEDPAASPSPMETRKTHQRRRQSPSRKVASGSGGITLANPGGIK